MFIGPVRKQASVWELLSYIASFQWSYYLIWYLEDFWHADRFIWYADLYLFIGPFIGPCTSILVIIIASYADLAKARTERIDEEPVVVKPAIRKTPP